MGRPDLSLLWQEHSEHHPLETCTLPPSFRLHHLLKPTGCVLDWAMQERDAADGGGGHAD